ncbi:MAG: YjbQ family protein [Acidobacteria bacterium]|nr:YjbQ family protein [Acidobacteriota bacterium]
MDTITPVTVTRHVHFTIATSQPTEFTDITDRLAAIVAVSGLRTGVVSVQTQHTTTAIVVNEHEPLLLDDFAAVLERTAPRDACYAHDDPQRRVDNVVAGERPNGHAHCRALFLPSSACLNVVRGTLQLGRWQRVFLVELDGPRERGVSVGLVGEGWR